MHIEAGKRYFSKALGRNVDVVRVYKHTVTIQAWGRRLKEGQLLTWRDVSKEDLEPKRSYRELSDMGAFS